VFTLGNVHRTIDHSCYDIPTSRFVVCVVELNSLITFFSTNPSAKLLSSPHAAYIVYFLHQHFKVDGNLSTPQSELQEQLNQFLETVHESNPSILRDRIETYLNHWSTGETRWLRRYYDSQHAESVYQLTPHSEDVLKFLNDVLDRSMRFVGTESRLKRIITTLNDLVVRGSDDPERRLDALINERDRINEEIRSIKSGETVSTHTPSFIREQFDGAISDLVSLQGDFRAVEECFKTITRDVQKQQAESTASRGEILGFALEAENRLKEEDQGVSFEAFVNLILSQSQQDELEQVIAQLDNMEELSHQSTDKQRIQGMVGSLSAEADKVLHTTRRLSATLKRLLDSRASTTRVRLASVLKDIRSAAAKHAANPPDIGMEVFTELDLQNVSQRTFWQAPIRFDAVDIQNDNPDGDDCIMAFRQLAGQKPLDWVSMQNCITSLFDEREQYSLQELLEQYPPEGGSVEVLGYLQLAHLNGHEVNSEQHEVVYLPSSESNPDGKLRPFEIPRVVFRKEQHAAATREGGPL